MSKSKSTATAAPVAEHQAAPAGVAELGLHLIDADPELNPRTTFAEDDLAELAASIGDKGVLQPILVRHGLEAGRFRVVAGERRRRASLTAGLFTIPAVVRDLTDAEALEIATAENIQRADMTPLEEGVAFDRIVKAKMAEDPSLSLKAAKAGIADVVRKTPRFVEQRLKLMELPPVKQVLMQEGKLSFSDARRWLQNRPTALDLPIGDWLVVLEVVAKCAASPMSADKTATECARPSEQEAVALKRIAGYPLYLITEIQPAYEDGYKSGRYYVDDSYHTTAQLKLRFGDDCLEPDRLGAILADVRKEAGHKPGSRYATPWLNGPFKPDEATLAAEADRRVVDTERRETEMAVLKANQRALSSAASLVAELGTEALEAANTAGDPRLTGSVERLGFLPPFRVTPDAEIVDHAGRVFARSAFGYVTDEHRVRIEITCVALNAALNRMALPAPEPAPAELVDRGEFVRIVADMLCEDCADLPDDEAEALFEATVRAGLGLDALLELAGVEYGEPAHDWTDTGAMELAKAIREDGLGQGERPAGGDDAAADDASDVELEASADDEETPAFLRRLTGEAPAVEVCA